jgi:hypothetical protein
MEDSMARERRFYPRKKQARYVAKLSRWQKRILKELWWWEDGLDRWLWEHPGDSLWTDQKASREEGMDWCPRRIIGVDRWEIIPWGPRERTDASRALRRLEQRGLVERIPFNGSQRTRVVRFTPRGRKVGRRLTGPHISQPWRNG